MLLNDDFICFFLYTVRETLAALLAWYVWTLGDGLCWRSLMSCNAEHKHSSEETIHLSWCLVNISTSRLALAIHDDVIKWNHFPRYWSFMRGIHRSLWIPTRRPVTRSFDVFFDLGLNKWLSKQSWGWWFEMPSRPLWRHRNVLRVWKLL